MGKNRRRKNHRSDIYKPLCHHFTGKELRMLSEFIREVAPAPTFPCERLNWLHRIAGDMEALSKKMDQAGREGILRKQAKQVL